MNCVSLWYGPCLTSVIHHFVQYTEEIFKPILAGVAHTRLRLLQSLMPFWILPQKPLCRWLEKKRVCQLGYPHRIFLDHSTIF